MKNKIQVLHIIKSLGRGGAETLLPETLKLHDQSRFKFHYIYFLPWKDQMVDAILNAGGEVKCLNAKNNIILISKFNDVVKYCRYHDISLIHCHLPWAGFVGRLVHKLTDIPTVYTEHNMQERYHFVTKAINKFSFNFQTLALGVSKDVSNSIKSNIQPKIPVKTLMNGVNTVSFKRMNSSTVRDDFNIPSNAIVFGNVAVFRFQKRLKEWLNVLKQLNDVNKNIYGIIVGAGPLEDEIKEEWEKLNLNGIVFFTGLQTNVKPYFEAMDVFMMTSSFEGLPIALLEAMSMECAVISTNAGGIKEVIRDNVDGLSVSVDKWQTLVAKSMELIENSAKLSQMKKASRARVVSKFSMEVMVQNLEQCYIDILGQKSNN
ncbi:glycosyltransferase [Christiangramia sp. SM2212]|uniref:Glycosyltransferase n=1 Tax=Christiangramia sediminicola TaxID=3073267 RepID=A0ABU1EQA7_9FLAO|nr:glycosyltransferase [Christiangramia sp. SM2212]MDR5590570.1 glycosyltransferase [Christiangramia sp. SM2212]